MTYTLRFEADLSSANPYTNDIDILLDLPQRSEPDIKREYSTTTTSELEQNIKYSIAQRKKGIITVQGTFYYSYQKDKSDGTLQRALANDDSINILDDQRIEQHAVNAVDTGADSVTVAGDIRRRVDTDGSVVFFGSQITNQEYSVDSVSYDAGNDETTVSVVGDIGVVGDGFLQTGIHNVIEQQAWLEFYVWANVGAPQHRIIGGRFSDETTDLGTKVTVENVITPRSAGQAVTGDYTLSLGYGRPV